MALQSLGARLARSSVRGVAGNLSAFGHGGSFTVATNRSCCSVGSSSSQLHAEMALMHLEKAERLLQEGNHSEMKSHYADARLFVKGSQVLVEHEMRPLRQFLPPLRNAQVGGDRQPLLEKDSQPPAQEVLSTAIAAVSAAMMSGRLEMSGIPLTAWPRRLTPANSTSIGAVQDDIADQPCEYSKQASQTPQMEWPARFGTQSVHVPLAYSIDAL